MKNQKAYNCAFGGGGWTRTNGAEGREVYSLLQLPLCDSPILNVGQLSFTHLCNSGDGIHLSTNYSL